MNRLVLILLLATLAVGSVGCAATVKPWDRDLLAKPAMQLAPHSLLGAMDQHIYFSKEASTGGSSVAGGGCGCN
jgi:hypothetical protein